MTPAFLPVESVQRKLKERAASDTEFRILLDCFALGRTIAWMFSPEHFLPPPPDYRMPEILKRFSTLDQLTLENFKQTITDLEKDYGCELKKASYIPYALSGQFDEALNCCCGDLGKPGTFHEQIRFTREIDPLLKSEGDFRKFPVCSALTDVLHQPIGIDINYSYFHAPDDAVTGKIPRDFDNYTPKSLENTRATSKEAELIISYGRKLNGYFHSAPGERRFLPRKRDIIWCNGQPVIFWGKGWCLSLEQKIDYEACFRYFCTGVTKHFSLDDWLELLPSCRNCKMRFPVPKRSFSMNALYRIREQDMPGFSGTELSGNTPLHKKSLLLWKNGLRYISTRRNLTAVCPYRLKKPGKHSWTKG